MANPLISYFRKLFNTDESLESKEWILLKINLPDDNPELQNLFSLQVLIRRDWFDESKQRDWEDKKKKINEPQFRLGEKNLQISGLPARLASYEILGKEFVLNQTETSVPDLELNGLFYNKKRVDLEDTPWLLEATLASGSVRLRNSDNIMPGAQSFLKQIWPVDDQEEGDKKVADRITGFYLSRQQFQLEIQQYLDDKPTDDPARRLKFVGYRQISDTNTDIIWQLVSATGKDIVNKQEYASPEKRLRELADEIKKYSIPNRFQIETYPVDSGIFYYVSFDPTQSKPGSKRELIKPGVIVSFLNDRGEWTRWTPQSLEIEGSGDNKSLHLDDADAIQALLQGTPLPDLKNTPDDSIPEARLELRGDTQQPFVPTYLPSVALTGASPEIATGQQEWWQLAVTTPKVAYPDYDNQPATWLRYHIEPPALQPDTVRGGKRDRLTNVQGPFSVKTSINGEEWLVYLDLPAVPFNMAPPSRRLRCTLRTEEGVKIRQIRLFAPEIYVKSPQTLFYNFSLNDPLSTPLEQLLADRGKHVPHSLEFQGPILPRREKLLDIKVNKKNFNLDNSSLSLILSEELKNIPWNQLEDGLICLGLQQFKIKQVNQGKRKITLFDHENAENYFNSISEETSIKIKILGSVEWESSSHIIRAEFQAAPGQTRQFLFYAGQGVVTAYLPASRALIDPVSPTRGNLQVRTTVKFPLFSYQETTVTPSEPNSQNNSSTVKFSIANSPENSEEIVKNFSVEFKPKHSSQSAVFDIENASLSGNSLTLTLKGLWPFGMEPGIFEIVVGPTRLAVPRDPNHGLIPLQFGQFEFKKLNDSDLAHLNYDVTTIRGQEVSSVLAMHPWSEWGPHPDAWLKTGRIRLHHRNLIQEHSEFESSFEDRFPPTGPQVTTNPGQPSPTPLLPFEDFRRAVRDRYTEASGNIEPGLKDKSDETKNLRNWMPGVDIQDSSGQKLVPQLEFAESADLPFPNVTLDFKDRGNETPKTQALQIRKPGESADTNWLEYDVDCRNLSIETGAEVVLSDLDKQDQWLTQRVVNSSAPLIFDRKAVTALEYLPIDDQKFVVLAGHQHGELRLHIGTYDSNLKSCSYEEVKKLDEKSSTTSITAVALTFIERTVPPSTELTITIYAVAGRKDGSVDLFEYVLGTASPKPKVIISSASQFSVSAVAVATIGNEIRISVGFSDGNKGKLSDGNKGKLIVGRYPQTSNSWVPTSARDNIDPILDIAFTWKGDKERLLTATGLSKQMQLWDAKDLNRTNYPKICDLGNLTDKFEVSLVDIDLYTFVKDGATSERLRLVGAGLKKGENETLPTALVYIFETELNGQKVGEGIQLEANAKIQSVRFSHIAGLDLSTPSPNYSPYLCVGYQDGAIKLWDLVVGLREIRGVQVEDRHLLAATAAHIPLANRSSTSHSEKVSHRLLVAGTDRGEILLWDAYTAEEISPLPKRLQPSHSLDNLGVIRPVGDPVTVKVNDQDWLVQSLKDPAFKDPDQKIQILYSISTLNFQIATSPSGDPQPTDIRFSCQELKVIAKNGELVPADAQNERFDLGRYGFFSEITSAVKSLSPIDYWPRLAGIPIFPTRLVSLSFDEKKKPIKMVFEAILPNPDDLATGVQEDDSQTNISSLVRQAIARQSIFTVTVDLTKGADQLAERIIVKPPSDTPNRIDWTFAVNRQTQLAYPQRGFNGSLARLVGQVNLEEIEGFQRLTLSFLDKKSEAVIFGRLWEIDRLPAKLVGESSFIRAGSGFQQEYYRFHDLRQAGNVKPTEIPRLEFKVNSEKKIDRVIRSQLLWLEQNSGSTTPVAFPDATQIESLWQQAAIGTLSSTTGEAPFEIDIFDRRSGLTVPVDGLLSSGSDVDLLTVGLSNSDNAILNGSLWAFLVAADSSRNLKILRANKSLDRSNSKPQDKDTLRFTELQLSSPPTLTKVRWVIRSPFAGKKIEVIAGYPAQLISLNHGKSFGDIGDTIQLFKPKSEKDPDTINCYTLPVDANKLELLIPTSSSSFTQVIGWEALNRIVDLTSGYPSNLQESFIVNTPEHKLQSGDWVQLINVTSGNQETQRSFFKVKPKDADHFQLLNPPVNTFTIIADTWSALKKAVGIKFNSTIEIESLAHGLNDGDLMHLLIVQGDRPIKTDMGLRVLKIDDNHFKTYKSLDGQLLNFSGAEYKYAGGTVTIEESKAGVLPLVKLSNSSNLVNGSEIEIEWANSNKIKVTVFRQNVDQFELWTPFILEEIQTSEAWWTAINKGSLVTDQATPAKILSEAHKLESGKQVILVEGSGNILTQDQLFVKKVDDNSFEILKGLELTDASSLYTQGQKTQGYLVGIDNSGIGGTSLVQLKFSWVVDDGELVPQFENQKRSSIIQNLNLFHTSKGWLRAIVVTTTDKGFQIWDLDKFNDLGDTAPLIKVPITEKIYSVDITETPFGEVFIVTVTISGMIQVWKLNDENPSTSQVVLERKLDKSEPHWARFGWDDDSLILAVGQTSKDSKEIFLLDADLSQELNKFHQFILPDSLNHFELTNTPAGLDLLIVTNNRSKLTLWARDTLLRIDSRPDRIPEFNLGVDFQSSLGNGEKLSAEITPTRQLALFSVDGEQKIPALPTLVQGIFYCFVLEPTVYDASRGKKALMLWVEGDLGEQGSAVELWAMRIIDSKASISFDFKLEANEQKISILGQRNRLDATITATGERSYSYKCDDIFLESSSGSQRTSFILAGESLQVDESLQEAKKHLYSGVMSVVLNPTTITLLALSSDGKKLLTAASDRTVRVWDTSTGKQIQKFAGHTAPINAIAISPDGSRIATGAEDNTRIWFLETGIEVLDIDEPIEKAKVVEFSPDGKYIFTTFNGGDIRCWDALTGEEKILDNLITHAKPITAIDFSPDGTKILTGSKDSTVRLWDASTGECIKNVTTNKCIQLTHEKPITTLAFSPDGTKILTGSEDSTVRLWNASTGECIKNLSINKCIQLTHEKRITAIAFSPDSQMILTGSDDKTARLWKVGDGNLIKEFHGYQSAINTVSFVDLDQIQIGSIAEGIAFFQIAVKKSGEFEPEVLKYYDIYEASWQMPISLTHYENDGISKLIPQSRLAYAQCIVTNNAQSESRPVDIRLRSAELETKTTDFCLREALPSTITIPALVDITGHWAELYIIDFYVRRIVNGYPNGTFQPNQLCLRAEVAVILTNAFQLTPPLPKDRPYYPDAAEFPEWAKDAIYAVAVKKGVNAGKLGWITGYDNGKWNSIIPVTRALLISAVCNVADLKLLSINESKRIISRFVDERGTGNQLENDWVRQRVATAIQHGLVIQYPAEDKLTRPNDPASRGLVVATLHLLMSKICQDPSVEKIEISHGAKVIGPVPPSTVQPKYKAPLISRSFLFKSETISQISNFVAPQFSINNNSLQVNLLAVTEDDEAFPPLDLNLEPGASRSIPRLNNKVPQIAHRSFYGPRFRYDLNELASSDDINNGGRPIYVKAGQWLLSPVTWPRTISNDPREIPQTVLFSEDLWISKLPNRASNNFYRTDNLLVLYRPSSSDSNSDENRFVFNVLSSTEQPTDDKSDTFPSTFRQRHQQYQQQLAKTGAAGVALHRSVLENGDADFGFVNSPFFSNIPLLTERRDQGEVATPFNPGRVLAPIPVKQPVSFDFRLQVPDRILQLKQLLGSGYAVETPMEDPLRADPYVPLRVLRYNRSDSALNVGLNPKQDSPRLHLQEATAFRDMPLLGQPSPSGRRATSDNDHLFLPRQLEIRYAPDKPGAVMHHILRSDVGQPGDRWTWKAEPAVDAILREPQQIKLGDRVTGEIKITKCLVLPEESLPDNFFKRHFNRLTFSWDEVLGKVPIDKNLAKSTDPWVEKRGNELVFLQPPLQGIFQFNDDVMEIVPLDAAIPGYQVISQIDPNPQRVQYRLPRLFAISQLDEKLPNSDAYRHHHLVPAYSSDSQPVKGDVISITASTTELPMIATFSNDGSLSNGDIVEIFGSNNNDANNDDWRVLKSVKNNEWYLLEDTVGNGWGDVTPATLKNFDGTPVTNKGKLVTIISASNTRPIIIETDGEHGLNNGTSVIIDGVRNNTAANGSNLRVWSLDAKKFAILRSSSSANTSNSCKWQQIQSRAAPFVQLSPETSLTATLNLEKGGLPQISKINAPYIRIVKCEANPRLNGTAWRVINADNKYTLHPLTFGNGLYSNLAGSLATVQKEGTTPLNILDASNTAPIKLKTQNMHGYATGDLATVIGVQGNTAANGNWRVVKVDDNTIELFVVDVPGGQITDEGKDTINYIVHWYELYPFDFVFDFVKPVSEPKIWRVNDNFSSTLLKAEDRPIWQIGWISSWENRTYQGLDTNQRVFDQYPIAKQIKFLSPSQLTPKLAAVWVQTETGQPKSFVQHRTLLFGDSAPAAKAQPMIEGANFVMLIKDNSETIDFGKNRNESADKTSNLYLIKYLTTGTVIYGSTKTVTET
jgi:WD40 repeat protein